MGGYPSWNRDAIAEKFSSSTSLQSFVSLAGFATPVVLAELWDVWMYPRLLLSLSALLIPISVGAYWYWTATDESERTNLAQREPGSIPGVLPSIDEDDLSDSMAGQSRLIATSYRILNRQAEYRDRLLLRANYFSLAVIAALVNIFLRTSGAHRALVSMVGASIGFAFLLATVSYKGTRDELNNKIRAFEDHPPIKDYLSVVEVYDQRDRHPIAVRSLSSYLVALHAGVTVGWLVIYFLYIVILV